MARSLTLYLLVVLYSIAHAGRLQLEYTGRHTHKQLKVHFWRLRPEAYNKGTSYLWYSCIHVHKLLLLTQYKFTVSKNPPPHSPLRRSLGRHLAGCPRWGWGWACSQYPALQGGQSAGTSSSCGWAQDTVRVIQSDLNIKLFDNFKEVKSKTDYIINMHIH